MLGAGSSDSVDFDTISLRDDHLQRYNFSAGPLPHLRQQEKRKRNADRRICFTVRIGGCGARPPQTSVRSLRNSSASTRSPVGAPLRLLLRRPNATAQLQLRASWDLVGAHDPQCSNDRVRKIAHFSAGVTRSFLSQSSELLADRSLCRPGVYPGTARERSANPPAGTVLAPLSGVPS